MLRTYNPYTRADNVGRQRRLTRADITDIVGRRGSPAAASKQVKHKMFLYVRLCEIYFISFAVILCRLSGHSDGRWDVGCPRCPDRQPTSHRPTLSVLRHASEPTDRQTDRQTDRHAHRNILLLYLLIPVLGSQPASDVSHKPGGRLPLLSTRPAVTPATLRAATNFPAW